MRVCVLKKGFSFFFRFPPFQNSKRTWYQSHSTPRRYLPTFSGEVAKLLTPGKTWVRVSRGGICTDFHLSCHETRQQIGGSYLVNRLEISS